MLFIDTHIITPPYKHTALRSDKRGGSCFTLNFSANSNRLHSGFGMSADGSYLYANF